MYILLENSFDPSYIPLANKTWYSNKIIYANKHGYDWSTNIYHNKYGDGWQKIKHTKYILENIKPDWVWVTGCDSMITNFTKPITDYIDNNFDMLIVKDQNNINIDSFLIKNSSIAIQILNLIINRFNHYIHHFWYEQQCIIDIFNSNIYKNNIKVLPQRSINAYNYDLLPQYRKPNLDTFGLDGNWQPGDLLIHWPATSFEWRMILADRYKRLIV
jgi:hypothetical protein